MILTINSKKHGIHEILIDDEDSDKINEYSWHVHKPKDSNNIYAIGGKKGSYKNTIISMHRLLTNCPKGLYVDHINHNSLDNRKKNLRICTNQQNAFNSQKTPKIKSSYYKGVSLFKRTGKYTAQIKIDYKKIHLGYFDTEDQAAIAFNIAALKYHGEYGTFNNVMAMKRTI